MGKEITKKKILNSFINQCLVKDYSEITVTSICKKAKIDRSTFYEYFQDQKELLKYLFKELTIDNSNLTKVDLMDHPLDTFIKVAKDPLSDIILKQDKYSNFNEVYVNYFVNYYTKYFEKTGWRSTIPKDLFARVYVNSALSLMQWENMHKKLLSTEKYNYYFHQIIKFPKF